MAMHLKLAEGTACTILVEGFPPSRRIDRFAWFCMTCMNPLYMREVNTGRVGLPGFYAVEDDAFTIFNEDTDLRTCKKCGTVHPVAYSIYNWNDTPEQKASRAIT
jgi:hypothetical protein